MEHNHVMSLLPVFRNFLKPFFFKNKNAVLDEEQEKESINPVRVDRKICPLGISVCYLSASLVTPNSDTRRPIFLSHPHVHDRFLYFTSRPTR